MLESENVSDQKQEVEEAMTDFRYTSTKGRREYVGLAKDELIFPEFIAFLTSDEDSLLIEKVRKKP
jgi:hypothetical protein